MSLSQPLIHCPNPTCSNPLNPVGHRVCESCQTTLLYRYLRAAHRGTEQIQPGLLVADKYYVMPGQIWLDTRPTFAPHAPEQLTAEMIPYLRLYPQRLHVPEVYGVCKMGKMSPMGEILLLDNIPVDAKGNYYPSIVEAWASASPVRQVYWLWQILELWPQLTELRVATSLFSVENLRVDGWRVRLRELYSDPVGDTNLGLGTGGNGNGLSAKYEINSSAVEGKRAALMEETSVQPSLQKLGDRWAEWFKEAHRSVAPQLLEIYQQMQMGETPYRAIAQNLNKLLLQQASTQHLRLRIASATDTGPKSQHNEDAYYPTAVELPTDFAPPSDPMIPYLSVVCDGIGGHEGGEVASQLAVQSLKLQVQALLTEVAEQDEIMLPDVVAEQIAAVIRIANNMIATRNDEQGRESRRRMGTTLVMALQLPQAIKMLSDTGNSHELYIANVGDSRAYWITANSCQQLTVDDDVATREVKLGRSLYRQALERADGGALTQALGTKDSEYLRPNVRRFILDEDGLLLLCSDGLSDNNWVEQSWADYAESVLKGQMSLESAVKYLINLANQKNGHDNTSVVLTYCRVSPEYPVLLNLGEIASNSTPPPVLIKPTQFAEVTQSASPPQTHEEPTPPAEEMAPAPVVVAKSEKRRSQVWVWLLALVMLALAAGAAGLLVKWLVNPTGSDTVRDRILNPEQPSPARSFPSPTPVQPQ